MKGQNHIHPAYFNLDLLEQLSAVQTSNGIIAGVKTQELVLKASKTGKKINEKNPIPNTTPRAVVVRHTPVPFQFMVLRSLTGFLVVMLLAAVITIQFLTLLIFRAPSNQMGLVAVPVPKVAAAAFYQKHQTVPLFRAEKG